MEHTNFRTRIFTNDRSNAEDAERIPLRMVTAGAAEMRPRQSGTSLRERVRRFMYPVHIIERVVNYLGIIGVLAIIAGCVLTCLDRPIPQMIVFAAGTAIGGLAGIAQTGNTAKGATMEKTERERAIAANDGR